jgi:hypothetical protein
MITIRKLAFIGLILSLYAVYVENKISHRNNQHQILKENSNEEESDSLLLGEPEEFKALCDIEAIGASCRYVLRPAPALVRYRPIKKTMSTEAQRFSSV